MYDGEEENGSVPHVLESVEYRTTDDADYDSWLLLDAAWMDGWRWGGREQASMTKQRTV